ncbi:MAG: HD-GYP domain-containing protein [Lachnospiraceae bacterium]|nr:HD-GYP domain-containing protein [Lachnospiraceae bacterium]
MSRVNTVDLVPGMILEADVYNYNDQLILPEGLVLNDKAITKLSYYAITSVRIKDVAAEKLVEPVVPEEVVSSYGERLRSTEQFKQYKAEFESTVNEMSRVLSDVVVKNAPLDSDKMVEEALNLLNSPEGEVNVFDMVHNMRQYDDITFAHSLNVGLICNVFAGWLGMSEEDKKLATECGILHDIGKLKIPESIIKKPKKLTDTEFKVVKTHSTEGYKILQRCNVSTHVKNAALMHHERCDGSGYPFGLIADQIDYYAKIVSIADVYEAMTACRSYRGSLCPFTVIEIFEEEGLQKYDTHMIMTFLENIVNTYMLNRVRLSNGKEGDIVFINKNRLSRPTIKCDNNEFIDLSKEPDLRVECLL